MRALVTGAGGQLGTDLARLLPAAAAATREDLDISDPAAVEGALAECRPAVLFNCAADNAVDAAEDDPARADLVNGVAPGVLAAACAAAGVRLVHFSTNYVFDGLRAAPYSESDPASPLGAYARSKLAGERAVLAALPSALVIRSSGLFGSVGSAVKGGSFPERLLGWAREGRALRVVEDQVLNPTYTGDLAAAAVELAAGDLAGVVHVVAGGCCSYWELARATLDLAGLAEVPIAAVATSEFAARAPRPLNGCLRSERVAPLRPWAEGLAAWWAAFSEREARGV